MANKKFISSGAGAVKVTYKNQQKPVLNIRDGMKDPKRISKQIKMPSKPRNLRKWYMIFRAMVSMLR